jgi:ATP adenylyltransferase
MKKSSMKHLWASWRMKYIEHGSQQNGCVFCNAMTEQDGIENLIVMRGKHAFVILNKYPYTSGHLMVTSFEHKPSLVDLMSSTRAEMMELVTQFMTILGTIYNPEGFNIGVNIGKAAGAGVLGHIHIHLVPRWNGDTNFMSAIAETRVLPETLEETYRRIRETWEQFQNS